MTRQPAPAAPKSDALRVRFDAETQARVREAVGPGSVSDFIREAVRERLDRLDREASGLPAGPDEPAPMVDLEPVLAALRDASAATLQAHRGSAAASARQLAQAQERLARLEQMMRWLGQVVGLIARQVGLKDVPVPGMPPAQSPPGPAPARPAQSPSASSPAPAQPARKSSPR